MPNIDDIILGTMAGETIAEVVKSAMRLSQDFNCRVHFDFNGVKLYVDTKDVKVEPIIDIYHRVSRSKA